MAGNTVYCVMNGGKFCPTVDRDRGWTAEVGDARIFSRLSSARVLRGRLKKRFPAAEIVAIEIDPSTFKVTT